MALAQTTKFEDRALQLARSLGRQLQANAIVKLNKGLVPKLSLDFLSKQIPLLTQLMVVANLQGRLDARKAAKRADSSLVLKLATPPTPEGAVFEHTVDIMRKALGPDLNLKAIEDKYNIVALRTLQNVSDSVEKDIRGTAYDLIQKGATVKEAKQVLSERFDALGLTPKNSFQLETIFRTASSVAYGAGSWAAYQDPDVQEILWGYTYSAVMDDRTRPNHAAADGTTLKADDDFWMRMWPPNGYNCRCEVIPLFSSQTEVPPSPDAYPDPGFGYNPGAVLTSGLVTTAPPETPPIDIEEAPPPVTEEIPAVTEETPPIDIGEPPPPEVPLPTEKVHISLDDLKEEAQHEIIHNFFAPTKEKQTEWTNALLDNPLDDVTLEEIQSYADGLNTETDLEFTTELIRNTDPDVIQEWATAGAAMTDMFPILKDIEVGNVDRKRYFGKPDREIPRGSAFRTENRVALLDMHKSDILEEAKDDIDAKWHPKINKPEQIGARVTPVHELGHHLGYKLDIEDAQDYNSWAHDWRIILIM